MSHTTNGTNTNKYAQYGTTIGTFLSQVAATHETGEQSQQSAAKVVVDQEMVDRLVGLLKARGVRVRFTNADPILQEPGVNAAAHVSKKQVVVRTRYNYADKRLLTTGETFLYLLHETAHVVLAHTERTLTMKETVDQLMGIPPGMAEEAQAELVVYHVLKALKLNTQHCLSYLHMKGELYGPKVFVPVIAENYWATEGVAQGLVRDLGRPSELLAVAA